MGSGGGGVGPAFRELMPHFILGSDEACLLASDGGKVKVFGDKGKHKHEKILADSRVSIRSRPIYSTAPAVNGQTRCGCGTWAPIAC